MKKTKAKTFGGVKVGERVRLCNTKTWMKVTKIRHELISITIDTGEPLLQMSTVEIMGIFCKDRIFSVDPDSKINSEISLT